MTLPSMAKTLLIGSIPFLAALTACLPEYDERYHLLKPTAAPPGTPERTPARCMDGIDNDRDGFIDCDDSECSLLPACNSVLVENTLSQCLDSVDNDQDTLIDCDDSGCKAFEHCMPELNCTDGKDNDRDGKVDCKDEDCALNLACLKEVENTSLLCQDKADNDGDAAVDCDDSDCQTFSFCLKPRENTEPLCKDKLDNDADSKIDCDDPECESFSFCQKPKENTEPLCRDLVDNDADAAIDCADTECQTFAFCQKPQENTIALCTDLVDNDGDKAVDCNDTDCKALIACSPNASFRPVTQTAPDKDMGAAITAQRPAWKWFVGNAGNDAQIAGPSATIGGSWGGIYMATGATGATRDTIDLSEFYLKKLRFSLRTTCSEQNLAIKTQWKSPNPADQAGTAYNATMPITGMKRNPADKAGDGAFHEYQVDYTNLVVNRYNAARLVLPFSVWCIDQAGGVPIEVRDLRFEGESDVRCLEVIGDPAYAGIVFCDIR